jgi:hypothetical protein
LEDTEQKQNSLVNAFPVLASKAGFVGTVSLRDDYGRTGNYLLSIQKILEGCP